MGGGEFGHRLGDLLRADGRQPAPPGGGVGGQRLRVAREFTGGQRPGEADHLGGVPGLARRDTGLPRLEHGHPAPGGQRGRGDRRRDDGLPDIRVGAGHEEHLGGHPATAAAVTAAPIRARSSSPVMYGGMV